MEYRITIKDTNGLIIPFDATGNEAAKEIADRLYSRYIRGDPLHGTRFGDIDYELHNFEGERVL